MRTDGERTGVTEKFWDENGSLVAENSFDWDYDDAGRLIFEELDSLDDTLDYVDMFADDLTGNRLETSRNWGDDNVSAHQSHY